MTPTIFSRASKGHAWRAQPPGEARRLATKEEQRAIGSLLLYGNAYIEPADIEAVSIASYEGGLVAHAEATPAVVTFKGDSLWVRYGRLHRDGDQPAVEMANGERMWFRDGRCHRDGDEPAIIRGDLREWRRDGKFFREGGRPVQEWKIGMLAWSLTGETIDWLLHSSPNAGTTGAQAQQHMNDLVATLRGGGVVLDILDRANRIYRLANTAGELMSRKFTAPCMSWLDWIIENRDEHFPELAAAMRARAMRERIVSAPTATQGAGAARPAPRSAI